MAKKVNTFSYEYSKGLWDQNPVMKQVLGMCPVLAVTVSAINGIGMALATTFVLVFSSLIISIIRKIVPSQVRIASYIVVIATFVTIADYVLKASYPDLSKALGPFIPLIVVNCIILGRAEAFASKNSPFRSLLDALGMGTGFLIVLFILSSIRELLASRTVLGVQIFPDSYIPILVMILPAGAFITLGLMFGTANLFSISMENKKRSQLLKEYLGSKNLGEQK